MDMRLERVSPDLHFHLRPGGAERKGWRALLAAGVSDWGGISPLTRDHVNPEARPAPGPYVAQRDGGAASALRPACAAAASRQPCALPYLNAAMERHGRATRPRPEEHGARPAPPAPTPATAPRGSRGGGAARRRPGRTWRRSRRSRRAPARRWCPGARRPGRAWESLCS